MPSITLKDICKHICQDLNLEIRDKELMVLLGPNGAGKTTLLNTIAGLTDYGGSVIFDSQSVDEIPTRKREVGYLFQNLVLFPHLDVTANIAYGLPAPKQLQARVDELLRLMKIQHLARRYPAHLSGGEQQRVALARALALSPQVLLLDEPLSSLDLQTAKYLRTELRQLQRKLGITTVYVTHDFIEAEEMADRVAVIQNGRVEQVAPPEEVFFYPRNQRVSEFIGAPNILDCDHCQSLGQGVMQVSCQGMLITVPHDGNSIQKIAFLPRDIYISETRIMGPAVNRFQGVIIDIDPSHDEARLRLKVGDNHLLAEVPHHIFDSMNLAVGKEVFLLLKLRRIRVHEGKEGVKLNV